MNNNVDHLNKKIVEMLNLKISSGVILIEARMARDRMSAEVKRR